MPHKAPPTLPLIIFDLQLDPDLSNRRGLLDRHDWNRLNHIQLGRYAEYLVKMECALRGLDVYTAEVDDKGIDFVVRAHVDKFYDIQVKSLRPPGYVFMRKDRFDLRPTNLLALVLFFQGEPPNLYLIPSVTWNTPAPPFVSRDYEGLQSPPEWGVNLSKTGIAKLGRFRFDKQLARL